MGWLEGGKYNGAEKEKFECKLGSLQMDRLHIPSFHLLKVQSLVWSHLDQDTVSTSPTDRGQPVRVCSLHLGESGGQI